MKLILSAYFLIYALTVAQQPCPTTFEGRIPKATTKSLFTSSQSPFNPKYVLGQSLSLNSSLNIMTLQRNFGTLPLLPNLALTDTSPDITWEEALSFPSIQAPTFDRSANSKPIEIEINDKSIFASSTEGPEIGLRRAELIVSKKPRTVVGKVTWFFSIHTTDRLLNLTHEYLLAFHEAQDYQADFWSLKAGLPMQEGAYSGVDAYGEIIGYVDPEVTDRMLASGSVLYLQGYKWAKPVQTYFMVPLIPSVWHNFGLHLDYSANELEVYYSTGNNGLEPLTWGLYNNLSGTPPTVLGETHFGIQKRPVGANLTNFLYGGTQESNINESLAWGGIWQVGGHPFDCGIV